MRSLHLISGTAVACFVCAMVKSSPAEEPIPEKGSEYLWEISKSHLKDPLQWPSFWRNTPQGGDPANLQSWRALHPDGEDGGVTLRKQESGKAKTDWRQSEERRTKSYLQKIAPLQPITRVRAYVEEDGHGSAIATATATAPAKRYLSQSIVLTTPIMRSAQPGGGYFPNECRIRYSENNESEILQLFDEVVLMLGQDAGVKPGDLYRTYEVGPVYTGFASGRSLGRLIETNGILEIKRVGPKSCVGRLIKCFGTISHEARACPLEPLPEVVATGYAPVQDGKLAAQVVWVTEQQQFPQPYSYAIVDCGLAKGYKLGDMVLFYNRAGGRLTDKVLGDGLVVGLQERSATILIRDLYPGIINRGDYSIVVQTATL